MRNGGRPLARGIVIPTERACRRRLPRADGAQFRFVQQHCAKRDGNAELAAVAAITYSDLLLACPDGWETGSCITLPMKKEDLMAEVTIEVRPNGPYIVNGSIELRDANGNVLPTQTRTVLCRCGASTNKPFCDGTHSKIGFQAAARAVPESAESATSPNAGAISAGDIKAPAAALDATESAGVISGVDPAQVENVETAKTHSKQ